VTNSSFEETLIEVWRQTLVENAEFVQLGAERYPVRRTPNLAGNAVNVQAVVVP
jgi:hypothetical protein